MHIWEGNISASIYTKLKAILVLTATCKDVMVIDAVFGMSPAYAVCSFEPWKGNARKSKSAQDVKSIFYPLFTDKLRSVSQSDKKNTFAHIENIPTNIVDKYKENFLKYMMDIQCESPFIEQMLFSLLS